MREIKFRAWDKEKNKMIDNFAHISKEGRMYTIHHGYPEPTYIPMQYTGKKDKNNKEVYDGYIVREKKGVEGVVRWGKENDGWVIGMLNNEDNWSVPFIEIQKWEIIGNIFENPELLK